MTIRRRLFIANMMMILSPIILIGLVFLGFRSVLTDGQTVGGSRNSIPVISASQSVELLAATNNEQVANNGQVYRLATGEYVLVINDANFANFMPNTDLPFAWVLAFIYLATVVLLANLWLAKYIARKITTPLDTLVKGVGEIKSGNLSHRITYEGNDEFDAVCTDFNEMANYLHEMVELQLADTASRKSLIAGISHDLRTPLTSIKMSVEGLKNEALLSPEKKARYVGIVERKTNDLEHIIKQLFLFSKMDMGEFPLHLERVETGTFLSKLVSDFQIDYSETGLDVKLVLPVADAPLLIDKVQFKNVVENILSNSLKYAGRADVQVEVICQLVDQKKVLIGVRDNGVGLDDVLLARVFDVFYRTDASRNDPSKGSGLGLAIAAKIVARFGGEIWAENVADGGLQINMALPIMEDE